MAAVFRRSYGVRESKARWGWEMKVVVLEGVGGRIAWDENRCCPGVGGPPPVPI